MDNKNVGATNTWLLKTKGGNEIAKRWLEAQSKSADKTIAAKATALLTALAQIKPPQAKKEQSQKN